MIPAADADVEDRSSQPARWREGDAAFAARRLSLPLARAPCRIQESIRVRNGFNIAEDHPQVGLIGAIVDDIARLTADLIAA
jgi:hypothetical protein